MAQLWFLYVVIQHGIFAVLKKIYLTPKLIIVSKQILVLLKRYIFFIVHILALRLKVAVSPNF